MKLCTFVGGGGQAEVGVLTPDQRGIVSLAPDFKDMLELIEGGDESLRRIRQRLDSSEWTVFPLTNTRLLAPIPVPPQFRDFNNHPQHMLDAFKGAARMRAKIAGQPAPNTDGPEFAVPQVYKDLVIFYLTNRFNLVGQDAEVQRPAYSKVLDYELEIAMIIGKGGKNIPKEKAGDHIFGYTIFNDFSARDRQMHEMEGKLGPAKGKSFDGGNVIGPWIVTKDEIPDPFALNVKVVVNGNVRGHIDGTKMIHDFPKMIEYVSQDETLYPGEIFGSGTYGGCCGLEIDEFLEDGDVVELEIEKIGTLRNTIVPARAA